MSAVVVSQPHKEIVGEGKNAKYIKDCTELHLGGRGIERLAGFAQFVNLEVLWLNDNRLQRLGGLNANFRIRRLYAQGNQIDSLKGSLAHFKFLQVLDLENNHLHDLDRVLAVLSHFNFLNNLTLKVRPHASLSSERAAARRRRTAYADASSCPLSCPRCACLASQGNPCCEEEAYRLRVIFSIPSLHILDCHAVKERERATARRRFGTGGVEKLSLAFGEAYERTSLEGPPDDVYLTRVKPAAEKLRAQKAKLIEDAEQTMLRDAYGTAHAVKRATLPHPDAIFGAFGKPPKRPCDVNKVAEEERREVRERAEAEVERASGGKGKQRGKERPKDFFKLSGNGSAVKI